MFELTPFVRNRMSSYNPFRDLDEMERRFFSDSSLTAFKTDIKDLGDKIELEAELPGFAKEDIEVNIENKYLTISATRKSSNEEKDDDGSYIRRERSYGSFSRSFDISGIEADGIEGKYENGILVLTMPKKSKEVPEKRKLELK